MDFANGEILIVWHRLIAFAPGLGAANRGLQNLFKPWSLGCDEQPPSSAPEPIRRMHWNEIFAFGEIHQWFHSLLRFRLRVY